MRVVFHQGGLSTGWSFIRVVSYEGSVPSGWSLIRVVSQGVLSSERSLIRVVSSGWSHFTRVVFRQGFHCISKLMYFSVWKTPSS